MTLLAVYVGCLFLGGILIGASMLGVGKDVGEGAHALDHGAGPDHAHDVDQAHATHAGDTLHPAPDPVAATLLSLRFWTFTLAAFGMTGCLLTLLGASAAISLPLSLMTGAGVGTGVTTLLRAVARDTVSSALDARTLRGRDAEVVLAIGPGKDGKIRLTHNGQSIELLAGTREGRLFERTERVLLVDVAGGRAEVTSCEPDRHLPTDPPPSS